MPPSSARGLHCTRVLTIQRATRLLCCLIIAMMPLASRYVLSGSHLPDALRRPLRTKATSGHIRSWRCCAASCRARSPAVFGQRAARRDQTRVRFDQTWSVSGKVWFGLNEFRPVWPNLGPIRANSAWIRPILIGLGPNWSGSAKLHLGSIQGGVCLTSLGSTNFVSAGPTSDIRPNLVSIRPVWARLGKH